MIKQLLLALLCGGMGMLGQDIVKVLWNRFTIHKTSKSVASGIMVTIPNKLTFPFKKWGTIIGIVVLLLLGIYGYGYYTGQIGKPIHVPVSFESTFTLPVPNTNIALYKAKNSDILQWINTDTGKVIGTVKVKDIPEIKKLLKPYGLVLQPLLVAGGSLGEKGAGGDIGIGLSWFKFWQMRIQSSITNRGIYPLGIGYSISNNSGIGLAGGIGYKGDKRAFLYYFWRF